MQFLKSKLFPVINNDYMAIQKGKQSNTCICISKTNKIFGILNRVKYSSLRVGGDLKILPADRLQ